VQILNESANNVRHLISSLALGVSCHVTDRPLVFSTEVDARLSFSEEETIARGKRIIAMYEARGVMRDRVLIKVRHRWS
jgi:transaldolase